MQLCPKHVPVARRCARMLLAAWNSADLRQIQNAIDQTEAIQLASLRGADVERLELLQEIAAVLRQWMAGQQATSDLNASLDLLRHIANVDRFSTAPPLETRVSYPH